ncbi:MAG TPA: hypothetical protein PLL30_16795 [Candidatus Krumholzibacteria bacterium]|nr:hypothetical protein [Candidatus Krumholzibacteria bacterium]HPD73432.1 hypothetical protein [Candidatus Krumholzibacteria bacterium]HRY42153.1 hypothetical protein [Candidatus Krumholzibacteria bacterium]
MDEKARKEWLDKLVAQVKKSRRSRVAGKARRGQPGADIVIIPSVHHHRSK